MWGLRLGRPVPDGLSGAGSIISHCCSGDRRGETPPRQSLCAGVQPQLSWHRLPEYEGCLGGVGGGVSDDLCSTSSPLSVEKQEWIVHTGKGLPPRVCLRLSIHLIGVVQSLRCQ